jgi:flagellar assembly protein FliH
MIWSSDWMTPAPVVTVSSHSWQPSDVVQEEIAVEVEAADLESQIRAACEAAYEEGRRAGVAEGEAHARAQVRSASDTVFTVAHAIAENEQYWQNTLEHNLKTLALAIARQVVGRELRGDAHTLTEIVRAAIAELPNDQDMRVRVNPQDLSMLVTPGVTAEMPLAPGRELKWIADATIEPGGCIVEARHQVADAQVDTALERIARQLLNG